MLALLLLISINFLAVFAVYDPRHPYQTENFVPAEADPLGDITCLGDKYAIDLPVIAGFNPNLVTMQKLCAKPQYNGGLPGQHVGAWCADTISSRGHRRRLAFDPSPGAQINTALATPRVLLGCLLRCYCNFATTDLTVQPVTTDEALHENFRQSTSTYEIKIDVVDDFDVPMTQHMGSLPGRWVNSVYALRSVQINGPQYNAEAMSVDEQNSILCSGSLPSFPLPHPFTASHFRYPQELCAVQFFKGKLYVPISHIPHRRQHADPFPQTSDANAGGYCHRTALPTGEFARTVWFSDELTPRADWTWNNFFVSASIRFYCWQHCACTSEPTRENTTSTPSTTKLWAFVKNHELSHNNDGSFTYQRTGSQASEGQVLPPQNRLGAPAGFLRCRWQTVLFGSLADRYPRANTTISALLNRNQAGL